MKPVWLLYAQRRLLGAVMLAFLLVFNCIPIVPAQTRLKQRSVSPFQPASNQFFTPGISYADTIPASPLVSASSLLKADGAIQARVNDVYSNLPMSFEANLGQIDSQVKFLSRSSGYSLFLTPTEAVLALNSGQWSVASDQKEVGSKLTTDHRPLTTALRMRLVGANGAPQVVGLDELPGKSNYFLGSDPQKWHTGVPNYARVEYRDVYAGINLAYYGNQRQLEYDLIIAPGADPKIIKFAFEGAERLRINAQGDLILHGRNGEIRQHKPFAYQKVGCVKQAVPCHYVLKGKHQVGFRVAAYDTGKTLFIDPVLSYSTYLGGSGGDSGRAIAVDAAGNVYVTGRTDSTNFPTNPLQANGGIGGDAFVAKLNPAGSALVYSTYLGGSNNDTGTGIAVDASGNAYVTGSTKSTDFPTVNAFQNTNRGGLDAFVTKLSPAGTTLIYSTYLAGSGDDSGTGIAVDAAGSAYITGSTESDDFPTEMAFQTARGGGLDVFVTKFNAAGSGLLYSTFLGGSGDDSGAGITVDAFGNAYVTGQTNSPNFPTASPPPASPFQATFGGASNNRTGGDAFVAKFNATGSGLVYSTYLGGSGDDSGTGIAIDPNGNAYVTGLTGSIDFPTAIPLQSRNNGGPANGGSFDAFVTKLNTTGSGLFYSTYLGGSDFDSGLGIAVDTAGNAYVTGITKSTDFLTANPFQAAFGGGGTNTLLSGDAFVTKIDAAGSLIYSTYFGGSGDDFGAGIAVDAFGNAYVTGNTNSTNFSTANPFQATFGGSGNGPLSGDAFIAKIVDTTAVPDFTLSVNPAMVKVKRSQSVQIKVNIDRIGGFTGNLTVTASNTKSLKIKLTPPTASTTGVSLSFTLKIKKKAPLGEQQIIFTGRDDSGRERTATLTLMIES